jgi:chitinase
MTRAKLNAVCNGITSNYSGAVLGASTYNPYYTNYYGGTNYNYNTGYNYNTNTIAPTLNFYTSSSNINQNDTFTLTWNGTNLSSCTASDGWYGSKNVSGSESRTISSNTNFTLTCYGTNGQQVVRTLSVYTNGNNNNNGNNNPVYITFTANPTSVFNGGTTALTWTAGNAVSCNASGDWSGTKNNTGAQTVTLTYSNRTYTLTCTNYNGQSSSQTVVVPVI